MPAYVKVGSQYSRMTDVEIFEKWKTVSRQAINLIVKRYENDLSMSERISSAYAMYRKWKAENSPTSYFSWLWSSEDELFNQLLKSGPIVSNDEVKSRPEYINAYRRYLAHTEQFSYRYASVDEIVEYLATLSYNGRSDIRKRNKGTPTGDKIDEAYAQYKKLYDKRYNSAKGDIAV